MRSPTLALLLAGTALLLSGCGGVRKVKQVITGGGDDPLAPDVASQIPEHMRAGNASGRARVRLAPMGEDPADFARLQGNAEQASLLTPEEDIVWTDPDNPDAELPEIEELIRAADQRTDWEEDLARAKRYAMREGRPILVWFTDSKRSAVCKTLSSELFSTPDFDAWARTHVVRVRLDWNVKAAGGDMHEQMDAEARRRAYLEAQAKRYRVAGKPHVIVMAPDGTVTGRYRGYRTGSGDFFWGKLKHSAVLAGRHHEEWEKGMRKKGYRMWTSARGDFSSFAKLVRYREGELILVEPAGGRFRTSEENLSQADRHWIALEKAKRR